MRLFERVREGEVKNGESRILCLLAMYPNVLNRYRVEDSLSAASFAVYP